MKYVNKRTYIYTYVVRMQQDFVYAAVYGPNRVKEIYITN